MRSFPYGLSPARRGVAHPRRALVAEGKRAEATEVRLSVLRPLWRLVGGTSLLAVLRGELGGVATADESAFQFAATRGGDLGPGAGAAVLATFSIHTARAASRPSWLQMSSARTVVARS